MEKESKFWLIPLFIVSAIMGVIGGFIAGLLQFPPNLGGIAGFSLAFIFANPIVRKLKENLNNKRSTKETKSSNNVFSNDYWKD